MPPMEKSNACRNRSNSGVADFRHEVVIGRRATRDAQSQLHSQIEQGSNSSLGFVYHSGGKCYIEWDFLSGAYRA